MGVEHRHETAGGKERRRAFCADLGDPGPKRRCRAQGVRTVHDECEVRLEAARAAGNAEQPGHDPPRRRQTQANQPVPREVVGRQEHPMLGEIAGGCEGDERKRCEAPGE